MKNIAAALIILFFAASCAAPFAIINTTPDIDTIQLCASYDPVVPAELRKELNFGLEKFIIDYNLSAPLIKVGGCVNENNPQTINLLFGPTVYVNNKQNIAATAGNLMGIIGAPIAMAAAGSPIILFFYFLPDTKTGGQVYISEDLVGAAGPEFPFMLKTSGYFNSIHKQNIKQTKALYTTLFFWFTTIEKQHAWEQKRLKKYAKQ